MHGKLFIIVIVFFAFIIRFWGIDKVPPSMYWDEVSQGYNSYSILKTGRDEHNELLPISRFKAFGDYKAPVYIYLDVPFVALFGKTTVAVRFPSILFGTFTVLISYLLACELFYKRKDKEMLGLISSFLLCISPWHIQLSRVAYEANVATFFTVLGVWLFFLATRTKSWLLLLSTLSFVLSFYAFNAHRIFVPLLIFLMVIIFFKNLNKRFAFLSIFLGIILLYPFISYLQTPESKLRFNEVNIFTDLSVIKKSNELIAADGNIVVSKILHNRRILFSLLYLRHYFDFFNPSYLFFSGDGNPRFSIRDTGELFLWELPILLGGFFSLFKYRTRHTLFIVGWFLLAPVAAATARETPHALRSETFVPTYQMIEAVGTVYLMEKLSKLNKQVRYGIVGACIFLVVFSFYIFIHDYFAHASSAFSYEWQYGYKQAVEEVEKIKDNYDYVAFTESYGRPYIYVLFYSDISPQEYWEKGNIQVDQFGFYTVTSIGKYQFRKQLIMDADAKKNVLYVGKEEEIPKMYTILKRITFLDNNPAFVIATRK